VVEGARSEVEANRHAKALLAAYAAGALSEPFAVLVASHLQMTAVDRVRRAYGEGRFESLPLESWPRQAPSGLDEIGALLPLALRHYASRHLGALEWRTILPGIKRCRIAYGAWGEAIFLRCRPGAAIPWHTHTGLEAVLVLRGGFGDASGHYGVGDISVTDGSVAHRPVADRAGECIIFVVLEAQVRLTGLFSRLVQRLFGF
jgi:putative transcriptional regulator